MVYFVYNHDPKDYSLLLVWKVSEKPTYPAMYTKLGDTVPNIHHQGVERGEF